MNANFVVLRAELETAAGKGIFKKFSINLTPTTLVLGGDGAEIDWFATYSPPPEKFQARLDKILRGEGTYRSLMAAYARSPKDVATVFGLGRKWADREDDDKAGEKYREVMSLDPKGKAGSYTDGQTFITATYTEYAKYYLAAASLRGEKPELKPLRDFIAANPQSRLVRQAYRDMAMYYGFEGQPSKDSDAFYAEFAARYPEDPTVLFWWLTKIVGEKGPVDKGLELAARLRELNVDSRGPGINKAIAEAYDLAGQRDKAAEVFGKEFMEERVRTFSGHLLAYARYWANRKENLDSALAMSDLALKLEPDRLATREGVASVCVKAGQVDRALAVYGPAWVEKKWGEKSDRELISYARFWAGLNKNIDGALDAAKKAVALQPKSFLYTYWATLSDIYLMKGARSEAARAMEKAIELAPDFQKPALQKKLDGIKAAPPQKK